jgi:hypothetical protein
MFIRNIHCVAIKRGEKSGFLTLVNVPNKYERYKTYFAYDINKFVRDRQWNCRTGMDAVRASHLPGVLKHFRWHTAK